MNITINLSQKKRKNAKYIAYSDSKWLKQEMSRLLRNEREKLSWDYVSNLV